MQVQIFLLFPFIFLPTLAQVLYVPFGVRVNVTESDWGYCNAYNSIHVDGGYLYLDNDCNISGTITVENGGTLEATSYGRITASEIAFSNSSYGILKSLAQAGTFVVTSSSVVQMRYRDDPYYEFPYFEVSDQGLFTSYRDTTRIDALVVDNATIVGRGPSENKFIIKRASLSNGKFLSNGVSTMHPDCGSSSTFTEAWGANNSGCGGDYECCPYTPITPLRGGRGKKGGTCSGGGGLGGGDWVMEIFTFTSLSGMTRIEASGVEPDMSSIEYGGGGSGGIVTLKIPCAGVSDFLRVEANGGNALSYDQTPAYGGGGGRIEVFCKDSGLEEGSLSHVFSAYGGMNAALTGWASAGLIEIEQFYDGSKKFFVHIYENPEYYNQAPTPYYAHVFFLRCAYSLTTLYIWTETRSDVYFAGGCYGTTVNIHDLGTEDTVHGSFVNFTPDVMTMNMVASKTRPSLPQVPPIAGVCTAFYTNLSSSSSSPTFTASFSSTPSVTSTVSTSSTSTLTATPTSSPTSTVSVSSTSTVSASVTPRPTPSSTSTVSPSPTSAPLVCGSDCYTPSLTIAYPQFPQKWQESVDSVSLTLLSELGHIRSSNTSSTSIFGAQQMTLSEVLRPGMVAIHFPIPPAIGESLHVHCYAAPPPWQPYVGTVSPLRLCVLPNEATTSYEKNCVASFPYIMRPSESLDLYIGVNIEHALVRNYTQYARDELASYWKYTDESEFLHSYTLPLPLDFRIHCYVQSVFKRATMDAVSPKYPLHSDFKPIPVVYLPASLPTVAEIFVEQEAGIFRSSVNRALLNMTDLLQPYQCTEDEGGWVSPECENMVKSTNAAIYTQPEFLSRIHSTVTHAQHFSLTLTGKNNVLIVADTSLYKTEAGPISIRRQLYVADSSLFGEPGETIDIFEPLKYFTMDTAVTIQEFPCKINWVSSDGTVMSVTTPSYPDLCGAEECGNLAFTISRNGFVVNDVEKKVDASQLFQALQAIAEQDADRQIFLESSALNTHTSLSVKGLKLLPSALICPPACPQSWPISLQWDKDLTVQPDDHKFLELDRIFQYGLSVPLEATSANSTSGKEFIRAAISNRTEFSFGYEGIYYVITCQGNYTDPNSGLCVDPHDPQSHKCSWGQGDSCKPCPIGALCPGGHRMYPRKGYWVSHEGASDGIATRCPNPAANIRCPGWPLDCDPLDPECKFLLDQYSLHNAFPCGRGYRTGSMNCAQCDENYYPTSQGTCQQCPKGTSINGLHILFAFLLLLAFTIVVVFIAWVTAVCFGGKFPKWMSRSKELLIWSILSLHTVLQATRSLGPGAPKGLSTVYRWLALLQFEDQIFHPACLKISRFYFEPLKYSVVLVLQVVLLVFCLYDFCITRGAAPTPDLIHKKPQDAKEVSRKWPDYVKRIYKRLRPTIMWLISKTLWVCSTLLLLLYSTTTNSVMSTLVCKEREMTMRAYFALDNNGETAKDQYDFPKETWERILKFVNDGVLQPADIMEKLDLPLRVKTMRADMNYVCYEGEHRNIVGASWFMLFVSVLGLPLMSFLLVRNYSVKFLLRKHPSLGKYKFRRNPFWFLSKAPLLYYGDDCSYESGGSVFCTMNPIHVASKKDSNNRSPDPEKGGKRKEYIMRISFYNSFPAPSGFKSLNVNDIPIDILAKNETDTTTWERNPLSLHKFRMKRLLGRSHASLPLKGNGPPLAGGRDGTNNHPKEALAQNQHTNDEEKGVKVQNDGGEGNRSSDSPKAIVCSAAQMLDNGRKQLRQNPFLKVFLAADWRPSMCYFKQMELLLLWILSIESALTFQSDHKPSRKAGLSITCITLSLMIGFVALCKPYRKEENWKNYVKIGFYTVTVFQLVANFVMFTAQNPDQGGHEPTRKSRALSITGFALCILLLLFLVSMFILTIYHEMDAIKKHQLIADKMIAWGMEDKPNGPSGSMHLDIEFKTSKWWPEVSSFLFDNAIDMRKVQKLVNLRTKGRNAKATTLPPATSTIQQNNGENNNIVVTNTLLMESPRTNEGIVDDPELISSSSAIQQNDEDSADNPSLLSSSSANQQNNEGNAHLIGSPSLTEAIEPFNRENAEAAPRFSATLLQRQIINNQFHHLGACAKTAEEGQEVSDNFPGQSFPPLRIFASSVNFSASSGKDESRRELIENNPRFGPTNTTSRKNGNSKAQRTANPRHPLNIGQSPDYHVTSAIDNSNSSLF